MLPFAHLGIGQKLAGLYPKHLPLKPLLLGTLLPDLVDKPLYYGLVLFTGRRGAELGLISGTRTLAHSLLFLLLLALPARFVRSAALTALTIGAATHLLLDNLFEPFAEPSLHSSRIALLFPLYGARFPVAPHPTLAEHFLFHLNPLELGAEVLGFTLLVQLYFQRTRKNAERPRP